MTMNKWYTTTKLDDAQGLIIDETTGKNIAVSYDPKHAQLIASAPVMLEALRQSQKRFEDLLNNCLFPDHGDKNLLTPDQVAWRKTVKEWLIETNAALNEAEI